MSWFPYVVRNTYIDYVVGFLLFLLICYIFVGIAVASDIFMNAIEKICGATVTVKTTKEEDGVLIVNTKEVSVWNDTVANLTLMALGSSAPEILLSVIEISEGLGDQNPGELGPGTIVGSAAFNLLIISAVCILSVPNGSISRIKIYQVFVITSVISLIAYIWMVIVLQWVSPDVVEVWEALVTLAMFPMLVIISFWADMEFCVKGRPRRSSVVSNAPRLSTDSAQRGFYLGDDADNLYDGDGNVDKEALQNLYHKLVDIADLNPEEIATILATKLIQEKQHSRMWYRMQASRGLMGGAKLVPVLNEKLQEVINVINDSNSGGARIRNSLVQNSITNPQLYETKAVVEFQAATLAVAESVGKFDVTVNRSGRDDFGFEITVESSDGTAKKNKEYVPVSETLKFEPYVMEQKLSVKILDNVQWNPDSNFFLKMIIPAKFEAKVAIGQMSVMEIIIEDDDKPGHLGFTKRGFVFTNLNQKAHLEVERTDGTDGIVSVTWKVVPGPKCHKVTDKLTGVLEFQHGEMKKYIDIPLSKYDGEIVGADETFDVELHAPGGGAKLGKINITTCAVSNDQKFKLEIVNVMNMALELNEEAEQEVSYKDQIVQSFYVNGGDTANATKKDWFLHIFTFPYKVIFSFIPPPSMCGGWLCFIFALMAVGFLTKVVGDAAGTFGNCIGMDPTITAITFVALGTSLPDTFASRIAAMNDKTADNAIGNVTGSNSVNVFLGLGVPWTIGAIFYHSKGQDFCVPAGSLTFNVVVYSACALLAVIILTIRRYSKSCGQAELGGPSGTKWASAIFLIFLWVLYIILSSVQVILNNNYGTDISESLKANSSKNTLCKRIVEACSDPTSTHHLHEKYCPYIKD